MLAHIQRDRVVEVVVELRGFEPLAPCMPLTSQPLTPHNSATRLHASVLLSTRMTSK